MPASPWSPRQRTTRYTIDSEDRLDSVNPAWLEFARENDAIELTADGVVGRSLWEFIAGAETRYLYGLLFRRVRDEASEAAVPFRCDSPSIRRFMIWDLNADTQGGIELRGKLIRSEPREPVYLLDPTVPRTDDFLTICSWCRQVRLPTGRWQEADLAVAAMGLFMVPQLPQLTNETCPACEARIRAEASPGGTR